MRSGADVSLAPKNISVFLRVRPPIARESKSTFENLVFDASDPCAVTVKRKTGPRPVEKSFRFNKVFSPLASQKEVYNDFASGAVDAAFEGQHGVLFVYGQTGSGKTYTLSNDVPPNLGVMQQSFQEVWKRISKDTEYDYTCTVSYVQLYNEILTDLLDGEDGRVRIQLGTEGRGDVLLVSEQSGLPVEKNVQSYNDVIDFFRMGMARREVRSTTMNTASSRSHTIFTLNITRSQKVDVVQLKNGETSNTPAVALKGRLIICDLAGSERVKKSQTDGKGLSETAHINGSLLVLGRVVAALTEKNVQHAPFRESKLTRILQYSLLGNGNTSIIVNCSPSDESTEETLSSIQFGQRAIQIKQDAKRHEVLDYKALYLQLMAELDSKNDGMLEDVMAEERRVYEDRIEALEDRVRILTAENELLRQGNGDARATAGATKKWQEVSKQMQETLEKRDADVKKMSEDRYKLGLLLAEEKRKTFQLAKKLKGVMMRNQMEYDRLIQQIDELGLELSRLKGTDYIGFQDSDAASNSFSAGASGDDFGGTTSNFSYHGDSFMQDQLDKAHNRIVQLTQEKMELLAYQSKSAKAIRLLHAEKNALAKQLQK